MELVIYLARQFGIKDMELEDGSGQEYRMDGWLHEEVA